MGWQGHLANNLNIHPNEHNMKNYDNFRSRAMLGYFVESINIGVLYQKEGLGWIEIHQKEDSMTSRRGNKNKIVDQRVMKVD